MPQLRTLLLAFLLLATTLQRSVSADEDKAWAALAQGGVLLLRHATAPGIGDPDGFRIGDCSTQRNLNEVGRREAAAIGQALRRRGITVGDVLTSQWCRTRDTGRLAFPDLDVRDEPIFNSYFSDRSRADDRDRAARALVAAWDGPGALVIVSHQVNVTALTGISPASAEGVVLEKGSDPLRVVGRLKF